jgi:apolipoprotein N-acyltransferase
VNQISRSKRYLLSVLSGLLMVFSFPYTGSMPLLMLVAWVPLLIVEDNIFRNRYRSSKLFIHSYLTFLVYNVGATKFIVDGYGFSSDSHY